MSDVNNVPPLIPDATLAQINAKLDELEVLLKPYERTLTDLERKRMAKMGDDSVSFVQNAIEGAHAVPDALARDFNEAEFKAAFDFNRQIAPLATRLQSIASGLDDAETISGGAAYDDSLEVYREFGAARNRIAAVVPYYDALSQRFAKLRGPRKAKPNP